MATGKKTPEAVLAGKRLKEAYKLSGTSRRVLAERSGIGYSTLGNYEQGTRELAINEALRIQRAIGVHAAFLMGLVDEDDAALLQAPSDVRRALLEAITSLSHAATMPPKSIPPFRGPPLSRPPRTS